MNSCCWSSLKMAMVKVKFRSTIITLASAFWTKDIIFFSWLNLINAPKKCCIIDWFFFQHEMSYFWRWRNQALRSLLFLFNLQVYLMILHQWQSMFPFISVYIDIYKIMHLAWHNLLVACCYAISSQLSSRSSRYKYFRFRKTKCLKNIIWIKHYVFILFQSHGKRAWIKK